MLTDTLSHVAALPRDEHAEARIPELPLFVSCEPDEAHHPPANYVRPIQVLLNGYRHFRLEIRRTSGAYTTITYPDISWPDRDMAERGAADYALRHDLTLVLDDDPDGRFALLVIQQVAERDERRDLETLWMQ